jgi:phage baseplate assembly protein W
MSREIYTRDPNDPNYKEDSLETSDEIETLLGQLRMILLTNRGEIIGAPNFGVSLEETIFSLDYNEYAIRSALNDQLLMFCPLANKFDVKFDVKFAKGTVRDICLIDIYLNGDKAFGVLVK